MGSKRLDSFNDCFRHGVRIRVRCWQCGRTRVIQHEMDSLFQERTIRTNMAVLSIAAKVKCGNCGAKEPDVQLLIPRPSGS